MKAEKQRSKDTWYHHVPPPSDAHAPPPWEHHVLPPPDPHVLPAGVFSRLTRRHLVPWQWDPQGLFLQILSGFTSTLEKEISVLSCMEVLKHILFIPHPSKDAWEAT